MARGRKVHALHCGHEMGDKGALTLLKDTGKIMEIPYHCYLVEDPEANILVDTSSSIHWKKVHPEALAKYWPVHMKKEEQPDSMLKRAGFSTRDVDYVVNTHLHYDHCGNNAIFPKARFLVHEAELAHAVAPGWWESFNYVRKVFDSPDLQYTLVRGDQDIIPGVRVIETPGHTEGHVSVVIRLEGGEPVALAGDAIYLPENLEDPILPALYVDARRYASSMQRLKDIVQRNEGTLLLSHSRKYLTPHGWKDLKPGIHTFQ